VNITFDVTSNATTNIGVPCRGGAVWVDVKSKPEETQFTVFKLDAIDFLTLYPEDHAFVLIDAAFPGGNVPYTGRGIICAKQGESLTFWFENFRNQQLTYAFTTPAKNDIQIILHASSGGVAAWADDQYAYVDMPTNNDGKVGLIIVGGTTDYSQQTKPAQITVRNLRMGRFSAGNQ